MMLAYKAKMTPAELAKLTGYTPQTINKWARRYGWATSQLPGVKGGKAQVIHVDDTVQAFLNHTSRVQQQNHAMLREPVTNIYSANVSLNLESQLLSALTQLNQRERQALMALVLREGIAGLLTRLGIRPE